MTRRVTTMLVAFSVVLTAAAIARAHCQIPCGIYDDPMRFTQLREHLTTIEKSMKQIEELSQADNPDWNQIVRWVMNKEDHANQFSEIVTYYFLAQRIKPTDSSDRSARIKYLRELELLHHMIVHAMKAKQTTDLEHVETLRSLVDKFEASYLGDKAEKHAHEHDGHSHSH